MSYHLIGIGGIGMSALARILLQKGHAVKGSDSTSSPLIDELICEGADIWIGHKEQPLSDATVVYSSGIKESNVELVQAQKQKVPLLHRSDLLNLLMEQKQPLLVTGTHGKTTTSALLSSVLVEAGSDPSFVVGGVLQSLRVNGRNGDGPYFVAEADESDGSFLKTPSFGAIVTNCENDHLDYWKSGENLDLGFQTFFAQVKNQKHLFWCRDDARLTSFCPKGFSYGFSKEADLRIFNYQARGAGIVFDLHFQGKNYLGIELSLLGRHNALNGAAVFGLCLSLNIDEVSIRRAFKAFGGVARRLEKKGEAHGVICFDDYGHHPTEIAVTLKALREKILERRLVVLFQPHRFSRTKDLWDSFLNCLEEADLLFVTDVYGAGETLLEGITGENLARAMKKSKFLPRHAVEEIASVLKPFDVLLTIGAGDVTHMGIPILRKYGEIAPKYTVGVLCGGTSPEHEVSLMSARNILKALDPLFYNVKSYFIGKDGSFAKEGLESCDVVIPVLHGPRGEDGMLQGFLDTFGIPYVGCDYRSCALCMQKAWTKEIVRAHQIPIVPYVEMTRKTEQRQLENFPYPVWVKSVHLGSSFGVSRATTDEEFAKSVQASFAVDDVLIVEQEVKGREIEFAVLGNEYIRVAVPCEILCGGEFYDYEKKYGPQGSKVGIPAKISEKELQIGRELAERAYRACGCKGLARVDFFLDGEGRFWLNEINPFPGFTENSGYPKMWEASGLSQRRLMDELVVLALEKSRAERRLHG